MLSTPRGFRDVLPEEALWREQIVRSVGGAFSEAGYLPVETPLLEERDLLSEADAAGERTMRLFDGDGELLMLRPDVTLPVARMVSTRLRDDPGPFRLRYCAPVFRESEALRGDVRQLTQLGVELIGERGCDADAEVLRLMAAGLEAAGLSGYAIALGSTLPLEALLEASGMDAAWRDQARLACHRCDLVGLDALAEQAGGALPEPVAAALRGLPRLRGGLEAVEEAGALLEAAGCGRLPLEGMAELMSRASSWGLSGTVCADFSVMGAFGYYTGMVVEAYLPGSGRRLGQGGRYDGVYGRYGRPRPAAGFALSLEALQGALEAPSGQGSGRRLRVAVSKGSLFAGAVELLGRAGMPLGQLAEPGRQLVVSAGDVDYIIVRPTDAPAFVAYGGADCGICGRDSLIEAGLEVLELCDLRYGECRFVVAEPADAAGRAEERLRRFGSMRVATKYPRITRSYFERIGVEAEVLKFHGNIELAPLVGMADRIVDITATGTTLRENNLVVVDDVMTCTARFFANPAAARTDPRVFGLAARLEAAARE